MERKSAHEEPHKKGEGKIKIKRGELRGETTAAARAATREKEKQLQDGHNLKQFLEKNGKKEKERKSAHEEPQKKGEGKIKKKIGELWGETAAAEQSSCPSCNERKRKAAARRPQFEAVSGGFKE
ncbi:hypothetical protein M9H77_12985 [Catharanthus roseus]|uniref:Uncharacterized protein n=1 Tax=Catharanthus roseus TaxID=4058 RepID=A0ACC0BIZ0_CATRO|nr:hypothetical protein M9H77_12985 [Catharanthus roseus]